MKKSQDQEDFDFGDFQRDKEKMMEIVQRKLAEKDFSSPEEMNAYLNEVFTGKNIDDIIADNRTVPTTSEERAMVELDGIYPDDSPAIIRKATGRALEIDSGCLPAHLLLGESERDPSKASAHYRRAIEIGRNRFSDQIEEVRGNSPEQAGLWGLIEARPFLQAMERLAHCILAEGKIADSSLLMEEILVMNPGDNQGIRVYLLAMLLAQFERERAKNLLATYADDSSAALQITRLLVEFEDGIAALDDAVFDKLQETLHPIFEAMEESSDSSLEKRIAETLVHLELYLPDVTERAISYLETAPWTMIVYGCMRQLESVQLPYRIAVGGVWETVDYFRRFGFLWEANHLASVWLSACSARVDDGSSPIVKNAYKWHGEELDDVFSNLDEDQTLNSETAEFKVGRNDPCPCGSGKKFKKCCG